MQKQKLKKSLGVPRGGYPGGNLGNDPKPTLLLGRLPISRRRRRIVSRGIRGRRIRTQHERGASKGTLIIALRVALTRVGRVVVVVRATVRAVVAAVIVGLSRIVVVVVETRIASIARTVVVAVP